VPGLLTAAGFIPAVILIARRPGMAPAGAPFDLRHAIRRSHTIWPMCALIVLVIATIYTGAASPTEAGAVGAAGALLIALLQRSITRSGFMTGLSHTVQTSVVIIAIVYCSSIFATYLAYTQVTQGFIAYVQASELSPTVVLLIIVAILLVLGCLLDQLAILSLTMPLAFPLIKALGYDPVWFGIIVTKTVEIGLLTPPFGLNVFVTAGRTGVPVNTVFRGLIPFLVIEASILALLIAFPDITLWLPRTMG
ncbi:MAG: TRAP transporter large permease subunit, partial [Alphaproteobacteria bacterium]